MALQVEEHFPQVKERHSHKGQTVMVSKEESAGDLAGRGDRRRAARMGEPQSQQLRWFTS